MTINIALATSEGLVLGCDSIASAVEYFVNPFGCPREKAADGTLKITITPDDIVQQVTQNGFRMLGEPELNHTHM